MLPHNHDPSSGDWLAFVDESESRPAEPHVYLLGATLIPAVEYELVRTTIEALRLPTQRKVHWHDDREPARHRRVVATIAKLDMLHLVVVRNCRPDERPKRRRGKCMERLLIELEARGVGQVSFEARQATQNEEDRKLLDVMRARRMVGPRIRIFHPKGPKEPALWVPDAVVGAVAAARQGIEEYQKMLDGLLEIIEIEA